MNRTNARRDFAYVHKLFEEQVERTPNRIALVCDDCQFTYKAINQLSNRLAYHLQQQGVRPETIVGLYVGNPVNSVIGILGILKAGGAYTSFNIDDPCNRTNAQVRNAQVQHIIVDSHSSSDLELADRQIINLDRDILQTDPELKEGGGIDLHPKDLAYVIHTSGTTGEPKSVAMSHEAFSNLISWHTMTLGGENVRTLLFTHFSFDASNQELFSTICVGGILYLIDDTIRHDPFELVSFIQERQIGRILLFFAPLQSFLAITNDQELQFHHLREIITAGEPLKMTSPILNFFHRNRTCRFVNMYGLTETHTVTCFLFPANTHAWPTRIPIGPSISHTKIALLDEQKENLEKEQCGEIYISGICLARGYLNRPDLTAEKFLPHPSEDSPGERVCRTGDLGRQLSNGLLECVGRLDHQVKIRGYRIELAEVEAAIAQHPCINEVVVIAQANENTESFHHDTSGKDLRHSNAITSHLLAYLVVHPRQELTIHTMRTYLTEYIPQYMIPSHFVFLDSLPLSKNGKVDRNVLPKPTTREGSAAQQKDTPRNPVEEVLMGLWGDVLDNEKIGIHTNFFEFGGDSIAATRLISEIRKLFQCDLGVRSLFENPTVAEFVTTLTTNSIAHQNIQDTAKLILHVAKLSEEEVEKSLLHES